MQKWLSLAAALLIGVALGFTGAPLVDHGQQGGAYPQYAESGAQPQNGGTKSAVKPSTNGVIYKTPCQEPQGASESELCAAWRSAEADEAQSRSNWLGVIGLLATLMVSARAAQHAAEAAEATREANRPWIEGETPTRLDMHFTSDGIRMSGDVSYVNHGNSPATHVLVQARFAVKPKSDHITETVPLSDIEAALDQWEIKHRKRGKIVYPKKPTTGVFETTLPIDQIRAAEGEPPEDCHYLLAVGISYRFGGKKGRTVIAYLIQIKDHPHLVEAPYRIPKDTGHTVQDEHITLLDTHEGYAS